MVCGQNVSMAALGGHELLTRLSKILAVALMPAVLLGAATGAKIGAVRAAMLFYFYFHLSCAGRELFDRLQGNRVKLPACQSRPNAAAVYFSSEESSVASI